MNNHDQKQQHILSICYIVASSLKALRVGPSELEICNARQQNATRRILTALAVDHWAEEEPYTQRLSSLLCASCDPS